MGHTGCLAGEGTRSSTACRRGSCIGAMRSMRPHHKHKLKMYTQHGGAIIDEWSMKQEHLHNGHGVPLGVSGGRKSMAHGEMHQ